MKKIVLLLAAVIVCITFSQCGKSTTCYCEEYDYDGYYYGATTIVPSSYGASNCSDLALKLRQAALQSGYDETFRCSKN